MPGDCLTALEQEGRAQRKAAREAKAPPRERSVRGKAQKRRGYAAEKRVEARLGLGFQRVPMSGALGGSLSGDLRHVCSTTECLHGGEPPIKILEVKRRNGQFAQWRRWMQQGGAQALVIVTGGESVELVVLDLPTFQAVLSAAGYGG